MVAALARSDMSLDIALVKDTRVNAVPAKPSFMHLAMTDTLNFVMSFAISKSTTHFYKGVAAIPYQILLIYRVLEVTLYFA